MGQAQYTSNRLHYPGQFEKPKLKLKDATLLAHSFPGFSLLICERTPVAAGHVAPKIMWLQK